MATTRRIPKKPDEIVTDRPDFTEASSTVGKGRIQLEAGYTFSRDQDSGLALALISRSSAPHWYVSPTGFEFRIGQNFSHTRVFGATDTFTINGGEDLYLGVKLGLTEQKKFLPESALILQTTVPTGRPGLTAGRMLPGMNYLYGWDLKRLLESRRKYPGELGRRRQRARLLRTGPVDHRRVHADQEARGVHGVLCVVPARGDRPGYRRPILLQRRVYLQVHI